MWGWTWLENSVQDVRYGLRQLRRNRGFTIAAILTLALAIGANTGIFSLTESVLRRPVPAFQPDRLVAPFGTSPKNGGFTNFSYPNYLYYRDHNRSLSGLMAYARIQLSWDEPVGSRPYWSELVTGDYFSTLGLEPFLGRLISPLDDQAGHASSVVVSYNFWRSELHADPAIIGHSMILNHSQFVVVGVAPKGFEGINLDWGKPPDFWLPMHCQPVATPGAGDLLSQRDVRWLDAIGRLKANADIASARSDLQVLAEQLASAYPASNADYGIVVLPSIEARFWPSYRGEIRRFLAILTGVAVLVLLIACSNLSALLLARGMARQREVAVRSALGASRARILRQLLTESLLLALAGGVLGLLVAQAIVKSLPQFKLAFRIPLALDVGLDGRVLAFSALTSLAATLFFGLAPAWEATKPRLAGRLKDAAGESSGKIIGLNLRSSLVAIQLALTTVTVIAAGLLLMNLRRLEETDPGFDPHHVLAASLEFYTAKYPAARAFSFYNDLISRVSTFPGVQDVTFAAELPLALSRFTAHIRTRNENHSPARRLPEIEYNSVGPGYFRIMGIRLLEGRDLTARDRQGSPVVAVINKAAEEKFWPAEDPVGQFFQLVDLGQTLQVVGISSNVKLHSLWDEPVPCVYLSGLQHYAVEGSLLIRTHGNPLSEVATVRREVASLDRAVPLTGLQTLDQAVSTSLSQPRMAAAAVGWFALFVLALAAAGVYGTVSYTVTGQTHEIGIRMALGAERPDVVWLIIKKGILLTVTGVGTGMVAAMGLTCLMASLLYGFKPTDPVTFLAVCALLTGVALVASYIPARRATKVDPMVALRYE